MQIDIKTDEQLQAMTEEQLHDYLQKEVDTDFQVVLAYKQLVHDTWQNKLADRHASEKVARMTDPERAALARTLHPQGFTQRGLPSGLKEI